MRSIAFATMALALAATAGAHAASAAPPRNAIEASLTVQVPDPRSAAEETVRWTEAHGGYFASWTDDQLTLRLPGNAVDGLIQAVGARGELVDHDYQSDDLGAAMAELEARLASRREMLTRYRSVLSTADPEAVVAVEKQMVELIARIEDAQGELNLLRHRAAFARVAVSLRSRKTEAPVNVGESSFAWMNTLSSSELVESFRHAR
ncbi:MAG: DUF4349 domain-containing protein [bacterium]